MSLDAWVDVHRWVAAVPHDELVGQEGSGGKRELLELLANGVAADVVAAVEIAAIEIVAIANAEVAG